VEGEAIDDADLVVPHPRMWERRFVLAPLAELAPDLVTKAQVEGSGGAVVRMGKL
jgi:2-amino-4-hydroxy-6-hydroxymethyldihydropteridine diphosphokinase